MIFCFGKLELKASVGVNTMGPNPNSEPTLASENNRLL